jgi:single-stranded DNA-binding protein
MYLNSVTIVGFVGADPEQRQARNSGTKFNRAIGRHAAFLEKRTR